MKTRTKIIIGLAVVCAGTLVLGACGGGTNPYPDMDKDGFRISVRYDANGGRVANLKDTYVTDVYHIDDVRKGVKLYEPSDEIRGPSNYYQVSNQGYFLAGWYMERIPRTDVSGTPLDADGFPCTIEEDVLDEKTGKPVLNDDGTKKTQLVSENGKTQGYTYSGLWDFEKGRLDGSLVDIDKGYVYGEYTFTLYAAWVPEYTYRIFAETETGNGDWQLAGSYRYNPEIFDYDEIAIPKWDDQGEECSGGMDYGKFPQVTGKTFSAVYADKNKTQPLTSITHSGSWDIETAVATNSIVDYYADYIDGVWFRISRADQLVSNARADGCYEILSDLDFTGKTWPLAFSTGQFGGAFIGNNHTFRGITAEQTGTSALYGGVFGNIARTAKFENITFENVTFNFFGGSRNSLATFGLFAGTVSSEASLTNVNVSGKIVVGDGIAPQSSFPYTIRLLVGNGITKGITATSPIEVEVPEGWSYTLDGDKVTVTEKKA